MSSRTALPKFIRTNKVHRFARPLNNGQIPVYNSYGKPIKYTQMYQLDGVPINCPEAVKEYCNVL